MALVASLVALHSYGGPTNANPLLDRLLAGPLSNSSSIVFAARPTGRDGHWYANFAYYAHDPGQKMYGEGGKLYRLDLRSGSLTCLLADPKGGVRDPQVHYDGSTILFSYRKGGSEYYHLYRIQSDGSCLRQLTDGPFDDLEPAFSPEGGMVFVSSRCNRWVNCWLTQVAVLYRCEADGSGIRPLSCNIEQDNTPWPLADGRILYTRWEYVDRSQVDYHHLWTVNPDGSGHAVFFGNLHPGTVMIDAKPVPDSGCVVASFSPGHGKLEHEGRVTVVDPRAGPDSPAFARPVSKGDCYRDPWAFSESWFMAAAGPALVVMTADGAEEQVFRLPEEDIKAGYQCHEPRLLVPRDREHVMPERVKLDEAAGRMLLADVNEGRNMAGVKPGEIKKLLVIETLPKPINYTGGMEPLSYGGTFTLERLLGTVPVEPDGSAYFEVPALRSVFFVALDERDMAVKRMQSFTSVQPGEVAGCVGCHELRTTAPKRATVTMAARRPPSVIEPVSGVPAVFDFPRDIQPVLDALCVRCHGYDVSGTNGPRAGKLILSGDHGPMYSHSYFMMTVAGLFSDGRNRARSNYPPRALGSAASRILTMLDGTHYGVVASPAQKKLLRLWIETGAPYPGTYAALGCGMIGGYAFNNQVETDNDWPETKAAAEVLDRRCASCHNDPSRLLPRALSDERGVSFWQPDMADPRLVTSRHIVFNLSRPDKSLMVLAPLAKAAGGWGLCRDPVTKSNVTVFADCNDPDYRKLLALCGAGKTRLEAITRFDMPGFKPRADWVREMTKYGILPAGQPVAEPVDVYAVERKYWDSFIYRPRARSGGQVAPYP